MKIRLLSIVVGLWTIVPLSAASVTPDAVWNTDYATAKAQGQQTNRPLLMDFSGSDWCGYCIQFDQEVLSTSEFQKYAAERLVLMKVDFPQKTPQPQFVRSQNSALAKRYGVKRYPTFVLVSPTGKILFTQVGYAIGGPSAFIERISTAIEQ